MDSGFRRNDEMGIFRSNIRIGFIEDSP